jgi:hypothetical protein
LPRPASALPEGERRQMAFPDFLLADWEDNARALSGGVSTDDVPGAMLALDSYGPSSEDRIKELVPNWAALKATKGAHFNRAAIRHVAAKVCDFLQVKLNQSERVGGEYEYQLQKIDWAKKKLELMAEFYEYLGLADDDPVASMPYIENIQRDPALYEEFEIEET